MSFFAAAFFGMAPVGSLVGGWAADRVGAPLTVVGGGAAVLAGFALFARRIDELRKLVRPLYVARGILPGDDASPPAKTGVSRSP
jgi:hypothetical protein